MFTSNLIVKIRNNTIAHLLCVLGHAIVLVTLELFNFILKSIVMSTTEAKSNFSLEYQSEE